MRYPDLPSETKGLIQSRLVDLERRSQAAKKEHEDAIVRLIDTNTWPVTRSHQDRRSGNDQEQKELVQCVAGLKDAIAELHAAVNDLAAKRAASNANPQPPPSAPPSTTPSSADPRPRKRRRLSTDDVDMLDLSDQRRTSSTYVDTDDDDLEQLHDKLHGLESRLVEVENTMTQHDRDINDELESRMEEKMATLRIAHKDKLSPTVETGEIIDHFNHRKFEEAEKNLNVAGEEIRELAEAMAGLLIQADSQGKEIKQLREENARLRAECAAVSAR